MVMLARCRVSHCTRTRTPSSRTMNEPGKGDRRAAERRPRRPSWTGFRPCACIEPSGVMAYQCSGGVGKKKKKERSHDGQVPAAWWPGTALSGPAGSEHPAGRGRLSRTAGASPLGVGCSQASGKTKQRPWVVVHWCASAACEM